MPPADSAAVQAAPAAATPTPAAPTADEASKPASDAPFSELVKTLLGGKSAAATLKADMLKLTEMGSKVESFFSSEMQKVQLPAELAAAVSDIMRKYTRLLTATKKSVTTKKVNIRLLNTRLEQIKKLVSAPPVDPAVALEGWNFAVSELKRVGNQFVWTDENQKLCNSWDELLKQCDELKSNVKWQTFWKTTGSSLLVILGYISCGIIIAAAVLATVGGAAMVVGVVTGCSSAIAGSIAAASASAGAAAAATVGSLELAAVGSTAIVAGGAMVFGGLKAAAAVHQYNATVKRDEMTHVRDAVQMVSQHSQAIFIQLDVLVGRIDAQKEQLGFLAGASFNCAPIARDILLQDVNQAAEDCIGDLVAVTECEGLVDTAIKRLQEAALKPKAV
jgi:hypothetical protein